MLKRATLLALLAAPTLTSAQAAATAHAWLSLFNGRDLTGWTPKIRGYEAGDNYADTFRVERGRLTVSYEDYEGPFAERFGHLFYAEPFSHYRLRLEYRFTGTAAPGAPEWAIRNSGVMLHAQGPDTMLPLQDFPISIEFQFLGGLGDGLARPTGSLCSPGTRVIYAGVLDQTHCIEADAPTLDGDGWVRAEVLVLGSERVIHYIGGAPVIEYHGLTVGGDVVSGHSPEHKPDGEPLGAGFIALQSEGHPVQFRRIELLDLVGCMTAENARYAAHYVQHDPARCAND